ncbi:phosphotransferase family protein [Halorubrum sp. SD626R]|uniref:phosphotransferase family protein n=1 Tax=Halorubrum sp. SD626R TaxID=1419722 RepID=UPI000B2E4614|nr:aminoglycoside phosphotransferase family protein [Halorubrum sp. SD626R]TKX82139.1 aminoglycoside phosphotransferase family protein [Halorubrum sp. SD626R]
MNEAAAAALREAFPERSVERLTGTGPSWNGGNETVGVAFADGGRAFCKVAVDGDGARIARELAVLRHVAVERPLAVPEVLAADPDAAYLVTAPAPGRGLLDAWEGLDERDERGEGADRSTGDGEADRPALLRRVGATLATLHAERFETHGEIGGGDARGGLELDRAPWPDVLLETIGRTREIGTSERLAHHYDAVIDCVEANRDRLRGAPAALLHGDVAMPNLFVVDAEEGHGGAEQADGIVAIDWELAHVGDPARDLLRAEDQLLNGFDERGPERYAAALHAGYVERAGGLPPGFEERRPLYEVVRILGRSGFIDQWTTYLGEPATDLVDRAEAELSARLAAV